MFEITSDFLNEIDNHPAREIRTFRHRVKYITDESLINLEIENLPKGLYLKNNIIQGNLELINSWSDIKDYVSKKYYGLDLNHIPFSDVYESLENEIPASLGFLKDFKGIHYSGRNVNMFGARAYVLDNHAPIQIPITITALTKHKRKTKKYIINKTIPIVPLFDQKRFNVFYKKNNK